MPSSINAILNIAYQDFQRGNFEEAQKKLSHILKVQPRNLAALEILGAICLNQGNPQQALGLFEKITKIKPGYPEAWYNRGNALAQLEKYDQAVASYEKATSIRPEYAKAWSSRGNVFSRLEQYEQALASFEKATSLNPDFAEAWLNRGNALARLMRYEQALASYDNAINANPVYADAWSNRGNTLAQLMQYEQAIASYDKAININPGHADAWFNRGNTFAEITQYEQAIASYDTAIRTKPDYAHAWSNRGNALTRLKQYEKALTSHEKATSLGPNYAETWANKGNTLVELKQYEQALASFEKAISINPVYEFCLGQKLHTQMHMCKWRDLQSQLAKLSETISNGMLVSQPFQALALLDEPTVLQRSAEIYMKEKYPARGSLVDFLKKDGTDRIRIGYYSADYHNHATSYLMAELFEVHDRTRFEIFGFSFGPNKQDEMRERVSAGVDHFHEVSSKSDQEIAELSRALGIDIAVDLKGFTQDSRTGIFAEICAPIQVSYLGYPGTMASPYIDYIIADPVLIPPEMENYYTEKVVYLPDCYQINDGKRSISKNEFTRKEFGLPDDQFVFCCFNNNYKILPETFDSWMRILRSVEGSVLWLIESNSFSAANLREEATARGVDGSRLIFAKPIKPDEHLARHHLADLFLDTLPYNAHTTASDALWVGLPIITRIGHSFAARVSASLLSAVGLTELITSEAKQYESLAIELAQNPSKLAAIRKKLDINRPNSSLFNATIFAKHIENAYSLIMENYNSGRKPQHIYVTKSG
jgi:predicted O-linked N-acetylglucosamine transferase (SPINDLY family)